MRSVLILSPHFPPATVAGVHRARHMSKHLPSHGWKPVVLRVDPRLYTEDPDYALSGLIPEHLEQVNLTALSAKLTRFFGFRDLGLRLLPLLKKQISFEIRTRKPDVVFLTGMPFFPLLISKWIKKHFDVVVVVDLQDPWVSSHGASARVLSKRGIMHCLALVAEPRALKFADAVTSVSETQNEELLERYPWLKGRPLKAIPIGGDPEDFEAMRKQELNRRFFELDQGKINLNYVGAFLPRAEPLARTLFKALRMLIEAHPHLSEKLRVNFVGTSNQSSDVKSSVVSRIAKEEGIENLVVDFPRRVPFIEALALLAEANGVLLIGSDERHYTASKIYPALMCGKPYLSIFHSDSSSHRILTEAKGGRTFCFRNEGELERLTPDILVALERVIFDPESFQLADPKTYSHVTAHAVAGRYAELFDELIFADDAER